MQLLQSSILDRLYGFLASREALALSATCQQLYPRTSSAYSELRFHLGRLNCPVIFTQTTENVDRLLGVLRAQPRYATNVHSIVLCDPYTGDETAQASGKHWQGWRLLADGFDFRLAQVVDLCTELRRFVWSNYMFGICLPADLTVKSLKSLRHLRELSCFLIEAGLPVSKVAPTTTCKLEQISIDCGGGEPFWCFPFLHQNDALRSLRLMYVADDKDPGWLNALCMAGVSWKNLKSLTIDCSAPGIPTMIELMRHCAVSR
jgi:hypothetical protein